MCIYIIIISFIFRIKCNIWHLYYTKSVPKTAHYYVLKIIVHAHLTALLECTDLFVLDVVNIFQHEYCTSNKDLQNVETRAIPSQLQPCSFIMNHGIGS